MIAQRSRFGKLRALGYPPSAADLRDLAGGRRHPWPVIDELMGHVAGRRGEREGSLIGTRYRHMTAEMQARVAAVIEQQLSPALAHVPQVCPTDDEMGGEAP